eukprot:363335-Chlamydomonas_euryale.AAC.4
MAMHAGSVVVAAAAGQCGKLGTGLAGLHGSQQAAVDGPSAAAKLAAAPRARQRKSREASVRPCRPNQASCGVPAAAAAAGRVWKKTVVTLVAVRMMMWRASTVTNADSAWRTLCRFDLVLSLRQPSAGSSVDAQKPGQESGDLRELGSVVSSSTAAATIELLSCRYWFRLPTTSRSVTSSSLPPMHACRRAGFPKVPAQRHPIDRTR